MFSTCVLDLCFPLSVAGHEYIVRTVYLTLLLSFRVTWANSAAVVTVIVLRSSPITAFHCPLLTPLLTLPTSEVLQVHHVCLISSVVFYGRSVVADTCVL